MTNTGKKYTADEVVLAFFKPKRDTITSLSGTDAPVVLKQLFGFQRVRLAPGASTTLTFTVQATTFGLADAQGHTSLHPGTYEVIFSRGCRGCVELAVDAEVMGADRIRLKTFRQ